MMTEHQRRAPETGPGRGEDAPLTLRVARLVVVTVACTGTFLFSAMTAWWAYTNQPLNFSQRISRIEAREKTIEERQDSFENAVSLANEREFKPLKRQVQDMDESLNGRAGVKAILYSVTQNVGTLSDDLDKRMSKLEAITRRRFHEPR